MVHALYEAFRVLRSGGLLIDLRPAAVHRRVWALTSTRRILAGTMRENLASDHAADAALKRFIHGAQPEACSITRIVCNRYLDSLKQFRSFLGEFEDSQLPAAKHRQLLERMGVIWPRAKGRRRIMVTGPLKMTVLRKRA